MLCSPPSPPSGLLMDYFMLFQFSQNLENELCIISLHSLDPFGATQVKSLRFSIDSPLCLVSLHPTNAWTFRQGMLQCHPPTPQFFTAFLVWDNPAHWTGCNMHWWWSESMEERANQGARYWPSDMWDDSVRCLETHTCVYVQVGLDVSRQRYGDRHRPSPHTGSFHMSRQTQGVRHLFW